ncbi:MAG: hypothetical protein DRQ61_06780 [Gammaproteobacteria bacterium]|nr:MAG: hypothetical protein DRQ56_02615 [Gammaproteobacteria bacterium]RLA22257.1 MAG: hypothetical protein DRQ61_06780 [Gammaproteobacteria bacterium]
MRSLFKRLIPSLFALFILSASLPVSAESFRDYGGYNETSAGEMFFDLVLVRPAMFVTTVAGTAVFLVGLPFSLLGGNVGEAGRTLVVEPAAYTFVRPLGDVSPY